MAAVHHTSTSPPPDLLAHRAVDPAAARLRVLDEKLARSFLRIARAATQRALAKAHAPDARRHLEQAQVSLALAATETRRLRPAPSVEGR